MIFKFQKWSLYDSEHTHSIEHSNHSAPCYEKNYSDVFFLSLSAFFFFIVCAGGCFCVCMCMCLDCRWCILSSFFSHWFFITLWFYYIYTCTMIITRKLNFKNFCFFLPSVPGVSSISFKNIPYAYSYNLFNCSCSITWDTSFSKHF